MWALQAFGSFVDRVPKSSHSSRVHVLPGNLHVFFVFCAEPIIMEAMQFVMAVGSIPNNLQLRQKGRPISQLCGEV